MSATALPAIGLLPFGHETKFALSNSRRKGTSVIPSEVNAAWAAGGRLAKQPDLNKIVTVLGLVRWPNYHDHIDAHQ
jgi:hypothetical protein